MILTLSGPVGADNVDPWRTVTDSLQWPMKVPPPPALEARSLYRFYRAGDEETLALQGISLAVHRGEFVAVTGPSRSGKSTPLACLAGMDNPDGSAQTSTTRTELVARSETYTFKPNG